MSWSTSRVWPFGPRLDVRKPGDALLIVGNDPTDRSADPAIGKTDVPQFFRIILDVKNPRIVGFGSLAMGYPLTRSDDFPRGESRIEK
jgi:hypothetical protein